MSIVNLDSKFYKRALANITSYGDTDVFPLPFENLVFRDYEDAVIEELKKKHKDFDNSINLRPPHNESLLSPVGYNGFRWVTQLDPLWNAYFLSLVLSIAEEIENNRIPTSEGYIFSYRYDSNDSEKIFCSNINWRSFQEKSLELASQYSTITVCDISDFYQRIRHHRLENALLQLADCSKQSKRINKFLSSFSGTYSHGIPVGGPAARILSELLLSQTDKLLKMNKIRFCRFADDYHIFTQSEEEAFDALLLLSEKLMKNEGLALQKAKTRIMSSAEFIRSSPLTVNDEDGGGVGSLLNISLKYDPYSPTADEDYDTLKEEISKFDILKLLRQEVSKSQIDIAAMRQIVKSLKFTGTAERNHAVSVLCASIENLYPIFPTVILLIKQIWYELSVEAQNTVCACVRELFTRKSRILKTEINQAYACQILRFQHTPENEELLATAYVNTSSETLKRVIILTMYAWKNWAWISDLRSQFKSFSPPLRRAFILASHCLKDEGDHWRRNNKKSFSDFEKIIAQWAESRSSEVEVI